MGSLLGPRAEPCERYRVRADSTHTVSFLWRLQPSSKNRWFRTTDISRVTFLEARIQIEVSAGHAPSETFLPVSVLVAPDVS